MAEKSIATQSGLNQVFFNLSDLADNLAAHVNAPLGYAHGFNFLWPVSFTDKYANSISAYLDSNDDVVGAHIVLFYYADNRLFSPASTTVLAGKTPMGGLPAAVLAYMNATSGAGSSNWITEFTVALSNYVSYMNYAYLLPHTRKGYWETHRNVTAVPRVWTDSAGHQVGTHSVKIPVGGIVYEIPAKLSLQGTVKPWMDYEFSADYKSRTIATLTWNKNVYFNAADNSGDQYNPGQFAYFWFTERNASGTLPRAIRLLVNQREDGTDPVWLVIPPKSPSTAAITIDSVKYHRMTLLFPSWLGGQSMSVCEYDDLQCVDGTCNSTETGAYRFSFNNDDGGNPLICRMMAIAYAQGTSAEKKYSFGNLLTFRNEDTDGSICTDPENRVNLTYEDPFSTAYTDGEIISAYAIGTTIVDDIAYTNLRWHADDPLAP